MGGSLRPQFVRLRSSQEHAAQDRAQHEQRALEHVEAVLAEPSDAGIAARLSDFWAAWDDVANRPGDGDARARLLALAEELAGTFRRVDADLAGLSSQFRSGMSEVAGTVMDDTNAVHQAGFDLDGGAGLAFFVRGGYGIEVNPLIAGSPRRVAASDTPGTLDGSIARRLASSTRADSAYRALIAGLVLEVQHACLRAEMQAAITQHVDDARASRSRMDSDDDRRDLLAYQHAHDAATRFATSVDELLETLLSGTGRVGL